MPANVENSRDAWWANLETLRACIAVHGRLPRQRETFHVDDSDVPVGRWLMHQRQRASSLEPEQRRALDAVLAGHPVTRDERWERNRALVEDYVTEHDHLPEKGTVYRGAQLGQWVADQRKAHRRGTMPAERVASLDRAPGWVWSVTEAEFDTGLEHFTAYRDDHDTGWVPVGYVCDDGYPLGSWAQERRRTDTDDENRVRRLTAAGFTYGPPPRHSGGPSPRSFAGSVKARRMPHLTVDQVLELRAVSALARAHCRTTGPDATAPSPDTVLLPHEVDVLTDAGWPPRPPTMVTRYETERIDWVKLNEQTTAAILSAAYTLFVNGWPCLSASPTDGYSPDRIVAGLQGLADLWDMIDAVHPFTVRERTWLTGELGTYATRDQVDRVLADHERDPDARRDVIIRHRRHWATRYQDMLPTRHVDSWLTCDPTEDLR